MSFWDWLDGPLTNTSMANRITPVCPLSLSLVTWVSLVLIVCAYDTFDDVFTDLGGNPSTSFMLIFALLASVVGLCSVLSGLVHLRAWRSDSLAGASSLAGISWAITALAFGYSHTIISL